MGEGVSNGGVLPTIAGVLPSMTQAVEIIGQQILYASQLAQAKFMEETQGREFAEQVWKKAKEAGKLRDKA